MKGKRVMGSLAKEKAEVVERRLTYSFIGLFNIIFCITIGGR